MGTIRRTILLGGLAGLVNGLALLLLCEVVIIFEDRFLALSMIVLPAICLLFSTGLFVHLFSKLTDWIVFFCYRIFSDFYFRWG